MPFTVTPTPSTPRFTGWKPFLRRQEKANELDKLQAQSPAYQQQLADQKLSNLLDDIQSELDNGLVGLPTLIADSEQARLSLNNHDYILTVSTVPRQVFFANYTKHQGKEKLFVLESEGNKPQIKMTLCANIDFHYSKPYFEYRQQGKRKQESHLKTESPEVLEKATAVFEQLTRLAFENPVEKAYYREVQQIKADQKLDF